jgi:hypothetical protein
MGDEGLYVRRRAVIYFFCSGYRVSAHMKT